MLELSEDVKAADTTFSVRWKSMLVVNKILKTQCRETEGVKKKVSSGNFRNEIYCLKLKIHRMALMR